MQLHWARRIRRKTPVFFKVRHTCSGGGCLIWKDRFPIYKRDRSEWTGGSRFCLSPSTSLITSTLILIQEGVGFHYLDLWSEGGLSFYSLLRQISQIWIVEISRVAFYTLYIYSNRRLGYIDTQQEFFFFLTGYITVDIHTPQKHSSNTPLVYGRSLRFFAPSEKPWEEPPQYILFGIEYRSLGLIITNETDIYFLNPKLPNWILRVEFFVFLGRNFVHSRDKTTHLTSIS